MMSKFTHATKNVLRRIPVLWIHKQYMHTKTMLTQHHQHRKYIAAFVCSKGQPIPSLDLKNHLIVKEYADRFNLRVFVETGTHLGVTVNAVKDVFDRIYSIELDPCFYKYAKSQFAGMNHIRILRGDSGYMLNEVLEHVSRPCLFFLDAHCSGFNLSTQGKLETAIAGELHQIFGHSIATEHVILIDNAECFTRGHDWPTVDQVRGMCESAGFDSFEVKDDVIRILKFRPS